MSRANLRNVMLTDRRQTQKTGLGAFVYEVSRRGQSRESRIGSCLGLEGRIENWLLMGPRELLGDEWEFSTTGLWSQNRTYLLKVTEQYMAYELHSSKVLLLFFKLG